MSRSSHMKIRISPEEFHRRAEAALGKSMSKTDTYLLWLEFAIEPEAGVNPQVPLSAIARANEVVRFSNEGVEWPSRVSQLLADQGYHLDRRNVVSRIEKCSGFSPQEVEFWADRQPVVIVSVPFDPTWRPANTSD